MTRRTAQSAQHEERNRQSRILLAWAVALAGLAIVAIIGIGLLLTGNILLAAFGGVLLALLPVLLACGLVLIRNRRPPSGQAFA